MSVLISGVCAYEQSGFEGFIWDKYTALPETQEMLLATEVTASWRYNFFGIFPAEAFFGPSKGDVYSASVQSTLFQMAKAVLSRFTDISSTQLKMPNIHFSPVNVLSKNNGNIVKFSDDAYLPTGEPHDQSKLA
ncbi:hypothetical protein DITRI_Ditri09bG0080100 [Diplodiscus trichospermus]